MKPPKGRTTNEPPVGGEIASDDSANAALLATWPGDRPGMMRLLQCRLLHRADWQYLGTRQDERIAPWPLDAYRCDRCERAWDRVT